jgi:hypothetical protein
MGSLGLTCDQVKINFQVGHCQIYVLLVYAHDQH